MQFGNESDLETSIPDRNTVTARRKAEPKIHSRMDRKRLERSSSRSPSTYRVTIAMLGVVLAILLLAWSAIQITSRENAIPALSKTLVELTEVDLFLHHDYSKIITKAEQETLIISTIPNFAMPIAIPTKDLAEMSKTEMRNHLISVGATMLYADGIGAFNRDSENRNGTILSKETISSRGILRLTIGQLKAGNYELSRFILIAAVILTMAIILIMKSNGIVNKLRDIGIALLVAALPLAIIFVIIHTGLEILSDRSNDPFNAILFRTGSDLVWIACRNFFIFGILGTITIVLATLVTALESRSSREKI